MSEADEHGPSRALWRHIGLYGLGRLLPATATLGALAITARSLTADDLGRSTVIVGVAATIAAFCFGWYRQGVFRMAGGSPEPLAVLQASWRMFWVLAGIVLAGLWLLADSPLGSLLPDRRVTYVWPVWLMAVGASAYDLAIERYRLMALPQQYVRAAAGRSGLMLMLVVILLLSGLTWAALPTAVGVAGGTAALLLSRSPKHSRVEARARQAIPLKDLVVYGAPLGAALGIAVAADNAGRVALIAIAGPAAVAAFAVAQDLISQSLGAIMSATNAAVYPAVLRVERERSRREALRSHRQHAEAFLGPAILAALLLAVWGRYLVGIVGGALLGVEAAPLVVPLAFAALLSGVRTLFLDVRFQLGRRTELQLFGAATTLIVMLAVVFWAAPAWGIIGVVWGMVAAQAVALLVNLLVGAGAGISPVPWELVRKGSVLAVVWLCSVLLSDAMGVGGLYEAVVGTSMVLAGVVLVNLCGVKDKWRVVVREAIGVHD